jgi:hypothetical protein
MAPGIIGVASGRPRPQGNMVHFAALVKKSAVTSLMQLGNNAPQQCAFPANLSPYISNAPVVPVPQLNVAASLGPLRRVRLVELCCARSGDKGDAANIGVLARHADIYPWLVETLTEQVTCRFVYVH